MAVDLKSNSMFQRLSLVLEPDCLLKLEHEWSKDRVRKVLFDRVEQILVWRQLPWVRIVLCAVLLALPGMLLLVLAALTAEEPLPLVILSAIPLFLGVGLLSIYLYCGKTTIRIIRLGKTEDITGVFRPGKVRRLLARIVTNIRATQAAGFERLAAANAAQAAQQDS